MRVRVFETDDPYSEQPVSLGPVRDVDLGQQGSSPEQILQLLSLQFPGVRLFAFNSQDQELPGWEEITVANAANLPAFLAHRKQLKAVRVPTAAARMLTRLQVVNSTAQPLTYATPCIATTSDPIAALLHLPDDMKEWTGVEEAATAFSARIPDSEPVFDGWSPCNVNPSHKLTVLDCMDSTFFKLANQLGGTGGLAAINFCTSPKDLWLRNNPDRVWTWSGRVIAAADCKQVFARPSLPGYGLLEEFHANPSGKVSTQLRQICGYLHHDGLAYGLLYTNECFWFLRYIDGILYISKGAFVTQQRPTVIALLLYVGELARQAAASSMVLQRQPGIVLAFYGTLLRPRSADSEQSMPAHHELQMGSILASGSTGTVRTGLVGDLEVAVKLPEVAVDRFAACRRLEAELGIYQDTLLRLQGSCIPRVVASGTVPAASGARLPFFAVDLLPYSLVHMLGALNDALEQSVLHSLQRIHERGVLHGDLSPDHVRFSSRELVASSPQPRWVDFSQARRGASCVELAAERDECRRMLRRLRAPMLLSAVVMQQRMIPLMHERVGIQRLRFV